MMAAIDREHPSVKRFCERHELPFDELASIAQRFQVPPHLVSDLLQLTETFQSLDKWGRKAQFRQAVAEVIDSATLADDEGATP